MGQTPRHTDQDTLDKMNQDWYWRGWVNGCAIGVGVTAVIALILILVIF